jgi:TRAP-type mannitol/chloroaromatic compound transport system permease small subunit
LNINSLETIEGIISFSRKTTIWSFLIGTLILALYFLTHLNSIIYLALFFMIAATFLNAILFIKLVLSLKKNKEKRKSIFNTLLLMLVNIPFGILYIYLGFEIFSSTFTD